MPAALSMPSAPFVILTLKLVSSVTEAVKVDLIFILEVSSKLFVTYISKEIMSFVSLKVYSPKVTVL